jgi:hypothetical protein
VRPEIGAREKASRRRRQQQCDRKCFDEKFNKSIIKNIPIVICTEKNFWFDYF